MSDLDLNRRALEWPLNQNLFVRVHNKRHTSKKLNKIKILFKQALNSKSTKNENRKKNDFRPCL